MFTDVVGSTSLWQLDPEGMMRALRDHERLLFRLCSAHGGSVLKTIGDAFMMQFPTLEQALKTALAAQDELSRKPILVNREEPLRLRIGVSYGPVLARSMRLGSTGNSTLVPDLLGSVVNLASRAESRVCEPGGIAVGLLSSVSSLASEVERVMVEAGGAWKSHPCAFGDSAVGGSKSNSVSKSMSVSRSRSSRHHSGKSCPTKRSGRLLSPSHEVVKGFLSSEVSFYCFAHSPLKE
jgi:hypothetical protein